MDIAGIHVHRHVVAYFHEHVTIRVHRHIIRYNQKNDVSLLKTPLLSFFGVFVHFAGDFMIYIIHSFDITNK